MGLLVEPLWGIVAAIALSVLPAWIWARRLDVDPLVRLLASALAGYLLMYVLGAGSYVLGLPPGLPWIVGLAAAAVSVGDLVRRRAAGSAADLPWAGLLTWAALACWILALQSRIVVYGLPEYGEDWYEHYHRSVLFLRHLPPETRFLGFWTLAARGPAYNTAAAFLMNLFRGDGFWTYQTVASVLSTFPLLPFTLLLRDFAGLRESRALLCAAVLLALAPAFVLDEIPVTKILAVGFVLAAIYLYREGLTRPSPRIAGWSVIVWALAFLTHFFAILYAAFFGLHWLFAAVRRRWAWKSVAWPLLAGALLVGFWFAFLFAEFGVRGTLTANTTLGSAYAESMYGPEGPPGRARVTLTNLAATFLPCLARKGGPFRDTPLFCPSVPQVELVPGEPFEEQPLRPATDWRYFVVTHAYGVPGALGLAGVALLLFAVFSTLRGAPSPVRPGAPGVGFWILFFVVGIPLNVSAKTEESFRGVLLLNLQPYLWLTAVFLIAYLSRLRPWLRELIVAVFLLESALATTAFVSLGQRPVPAELRADGALLGTARATFNDEYLANYRCKLQHRAVFLSDRPGGRSPLVVGSAAGLAVALLAWGRVLAARREARHGRSGVPAPEER